MTRPNARSPLAEYLVAVRNGVVLGVGALAVILPVLHWTADEPRPPAHVVASQAPAPRPAASAPSMAPARTARIQPPAIQRGQSRPVARRPLARPPEPLRLASFGDEQASADARHVAHWVVHSGDHQRKSFVIIDKRDAKVYVFNPRGELQAASPALLGAATGDHTVPGIGDKPLSAVLPHEKTTPAGRFVAEPGRNLQGEDIIWVDYDAAVSMHRVRPLVAAERRLERLASPTAADNRISFGCINLPVAFYERVLSPTVKATGAIVYVLPEVRTVQDVFRSYDVLGAQQLAQR